MTRILQLFCHFSLPHGLIALLMLNGVASPILSQESKAAKNALFAKPLNALIHDVTETVLTSHINPPTRQQMILDVIRSIANTTQQSVSPDLATAVSNTAGADELYQLLASELTKLGVTDTESAVDLKVAESAFSSSHFLDGFHFINESNARAEEQLASNRYVGIGVQLGQLRDGEGQRFMEVIADGPAEEAGILKNDVLESVDGKPTISTSLEDVITMLRGPESTSVSVTVRTGRQPARKLSLVRRVVPIKTAHLTDQNHQERALLIKFDRITASSLNELQKLVAKSEEAFKPSRTIVLDLRSANAVDIHYLHLFADGILDAAILGQVQSREGTRILKTEDGNLFGERKIVILFSQGKSDEIDLLALAAMEAGLKVIPSSKVGSDRGFQPYEPSQNTIPVVGTKYLIQLTTYRLLTKTGKTIGPEAFDRLIPLWTLPSMNEALQNNNSDLSQVLQHLGN